MEYTEFQALPHLGQGVVPLAESRPRVRALQPACRLHSLRPEVRGPFLFLGEEKFVVKGVTYGTFASDQSGDLFPPWEVVRRDFARMREVGINTIRTYTVPPEWFLEEAAAAGLRVLIGIYWDGRDCIFGERQAARRAEATVREAVARCRAFPDVVLAYVIGNEVPPLVARFHGRTVIERLLRRLYEAAKEEDPEGLVTYANYPTTEFLQLEFLDFYTLNLYLLEKQVYSAYLERMMIETKGKPLLLGETGDDSRRRGEGWQAELLDWLIPVTFDKGACGLCLFSWTDEWVVGGHRIDDWAFGLVDAARRPKQALEVVRRRFSESPFQGRGPRGPRVSVVVCNYNGGKTLDETLSHLEKVQYPDFEIILVDDGSTDDSLAVARRHGERVKTISQENRGLSVARNVGARAASGEIVAYIDSDAYPDPDWLRFLVLSMSSGDFAGAGGPNLTPPLDGLTAQFIALCPGNPTCVLKDNVQAEHIAGVNMAFHREGLLGVGGFDPIHTKAGDDVDICWRFEDARQRLAYSPAAVVWHHRRPSVWRFLKQQLGYGEAENQLETKHPERFNLGGCIRWAGRIYLAPRRITSLFRPFIYHGKLGTAMFQTLYQKDPSALMDGPRTVQWYLFCAVLLALSPLSLWLAAVGLVFLFVSLGVAVLSGLTTEVPVRLTRWQTLKKVSIVALLHFLHPLVRFYGRARARWREVRPADLLLRQRWWRAKYIFKELSVLGRASLDVRRYWGAGSAEREACLRSIQRELKRQKTVAFLGDDWDGHDLIVHGSMIVTGRLYTAPEHYDQSLCCGFKANFTPVGRALVILAMVEALVVLALNHMVLPLLVICALTLWYTLGQRARLRAKLWEAVETVMAAQGTKRYEK